MSSSYDLIFRETLEEFPRNGRYVAKDNDRAYSYIVYNEDFVYIKIVHHDEREIKIDLVKLTYNYLEYEKNRGMNIMTEDYIPMLDMAFGDSDILYVVILVNNMSYIMCIDINSLEYKMFTLGLSMNRIKFQNKKLFFNCYNEDNDNIVDRHSWNPQTEEVLSYESVFNNGGAINYFAWIDNIDYNATLYNPDRLNVYEDDIFVAEIVAKQSTEGTYSFFILIRRKEDIENVIEEIDISQYLEQHNQEIVNNFPSDLGYDLNHKITFPDNERVLYGSLLEKAKAVFNVRELRIININEGLFENVLWFMFENDYRYDNTKEVFQLNKPKDKNRIKSHYKSQV